MKSPTSRRQRQRRRSSLSAAQGLAVRLARAAAPALLLAARRAGCAAGGNPDVSPNQKHNPSPAEIYQSVSFCSNDAQCLNGGSCTSSAYAAATPSNATGVSFSGGGGGGGGGGTRRCHCPAGYGGSHCQDHCPLWCQNGGYCQLLDQRYPGQYASDLDRQGNSASGGRARDAPPYGCKCRGLFAGKLCEIPYTNCPENRRCYNGGSCPSGDEGKDANETSAAPCRCPIGYRGDGCEQRDFAAVVAAPPADAGRSRAGLSAGVPVAVLCVAALAAAAMVARRRRRADPTGPAKVPARRSLRRRCRAAVLQMVRPARGGRGTGHGARNLRPHHPEYWEAEEMPGRDSSRSFSFAGSEGHARPYRDQLAATDEGEGEEDDNDETGEPREGKRGPFRFFFGDGGTLLARDDADGCDEAERFEENENDGVLGDGDDDGQSSQHRWRNIV